MTPQKAKPRQFLSRSEYLRRKNECSSEERSEAEEGRVVEPAGLLVLQHEGADERRVDVPVESQRLFFRDLRPPPLRRRRGRCLLRITRQSCRRRCAPAHLSCGRHRRRLGRHRRRRGYRWHHCRRHGCRWRWRRCERLRWLGDRCGTEFLSFAKLSGEGRGLGQTATLDELQVIQLELVGERSLLQERRGSLLREIRVGGDLRGRGGCRDD